MKLRRAILAFLLLLPAITSLLSCNDVTIEKRTRECLSELSGAGELVTCEYTVSKVVKADDMVPWKIGERKILFSVKGYVRAGIDMASYRPEKTVIDPSRRSIMLVLPPPRLLSVDIPAEQIREEYSHITGLRDHFSAEERRDLLRQGEMVIRAQAPKMGVLHDARLNAVSYFDALLRRLGYEDINIYFDFK